MAKTPSKPAKKPKKKGLGSKALFAALGSDNIDTQNHRINEILGAANFMQNDPEEIQSKKMLSVAETIESLAPRGELERMLVWQMVAAHGGAMECLRRAMIPNQSFEGRDANLKHAEKLMALYTKQLETLNKHRGKGQQKITVKHVNVAAGGQAIVGDVMAKEADPKQSNQKLTDDKEVPIDITPSKKAPKSKSRK